ncbi:MAG: hypothetical protein QOJ50_3055 [Cryptosporangiaceae bacterium]|nr:hypothetical protein [Cryptosporangiaceae bacterium]
MSFYTRRAEELRRRGRQRADHARYLACRLDKRQLLRRAWGLARDGARRFGGSPRLYLDEAMRLAWAEVKARREAARGMAQDRLALDGSDRFALTVVGVLALREAEVARATA